MNNGPPIPEAQRAGRRDFRRRAGLQATAAAGLALLAAACGGPSGPAAPTAHQTAYQRELAYAACMRAHGLPSFPDPRADGTFNATRQNANDFHGPQFLSANKPCAHLEGPGMTPVQQQQFTKPGPEVRGVHARTRDRGLPVLPAARRRSRRSWCACRFARRRSQFAAIPGRATGLRQAPAFGKWVVMSSAVTPETATTTGVSGHQGSTRTRPAAARIEDAIIATAVVALLAAACAVGSGSPATVADAPGRQAFKYSQCMRSHDLRGPVPSGDSVCVTPGPPHHSTSAKRCGSPSAVTP